MKITYCVIAVDEDGNQIHSEQSELSMDDALNLCEDNERVKQAGENVCFHKTIIK
jgi:hypothetical protein